MLARVAHERRDSAFTLIEMLVAMVLLSIVIAVALGFIVNGFSGSNKSLNERRAIQQANRTMASLEQVMRSTKSPDRDEAVLPDTNALSQALLSGTAPVGKRSATATGQVTLDVNDIVYADSSRLVVRSDVLPRAGVECVEYEVRTVAGRRTLFRNVWFGAAPGAAPRVCRIPPATTPAPDLSETMIATVGQ
jgi:prepilin-type N-terminal cleavage/methylation domain-containing protein